MTIELDAHVPEIDPSYIPYGFFSNLEKIIKSKQFFPTNIVGHFGNGKSKMVEQVCAKLNRPLLRIAMHKEINETALIGGQTLINHNIVFKEGPVLKAMRTGTIVLFDELDRATGEALLCLQSIMEGSSYYNKYTGETIYPKPGFNIIATANTKGYGATSKYLSQILDEAFLDRFAITHEQEYPNLRTEKSILSFHLKDKEFVENLCKWSQVIRESFYQGTIDTLVSTRRLIQIANAYAIFGDKKTALELTMNRYEDEERDAFLDLYWKIDANEDIADVQEAA